VSLGDRARSPAAAVAGGDVSIRFARGIAIVLALALLAQLAWATTDAYPWLLVVAHGGRAPPGLWLAVALEACLALAVTLVAIRADIVARLALMPVWGLVLVISLESPRGRHGFLGTWPFCLAFAIAALAWSVARRREVAMAKPSAIESTEP
jgi:hypothetical protein